MRSLINVLKPCSNGNFHHLKKTFEYLLGRNDRAFLDFIYLRNCPDINRPYFLKFLLYCEYSVIQDLILFIALLPTKKDLKYLRKERFTQLLEMQFINEIIHLMDCHRPEIAKGASELLVRLIDEGNRVEDAHIIFKSWMVNSKLIGKMAEVRF